MLLKGLTSVEHKPRLARSCWTLVLLAAPCAQLATLVWPLRLFPLLLLQQFWSTDAQSPFEHAARLEPRHELLPWTAFSRRKQPDWQPRAVPLVLLLAVCLRRVLPQLLLLRRLRQLLQQVLAALPLSAAAAAAGSPVRDFLLPVYATPRHKLLHRQLAAVTRFGEIQTLLG